MFTVSFGKHDIDTNSQWKLLTGLQNSCSVLTAREAISVRFNCSERHEERKLQNLRKEKKREGVKNGEGKTFKDRWARKWVSKKNEKNEKKKRKCTWHVL